MPLVVPTDRTHEVATLLEEAQQIAKTLASMDYRTISIEEFMRLESRHHEIRMRIEELARRE